MIRALIADDEPLARGVVRALLAGYSDIEVVDESRSGVETLGAIRRWTPDLVFLDIQMPDLDGFGVLSSLEAEIVPAVVFVTAFEDFAIRAFDEAALDYLVKPFTDERFHKTVARARRRVASVDPVRSHERSSRSRNASIRTLHLGEATSSACSCRLATDRCRCGSPIFRGSKPTTTTRGCTRTDGRSS